MAVFVDHGKFPIELVLTYSSPYDYWHDRYQAYYRVGIRRFLASAAVRFRSVSLSRFPKALRALRRIRHSSQLERILRGRGSHLLSTASDWLARGFSGARLPPSRTFHPLVGQYLFRMKDGREWKVCIDAQDGGEIASRELLGWSDLYFKASYWPSMAY